MVKLDFLNAFNSVRRDCMLHSVLDLCPSVFRLLFIAHLPFWEDCVLGSAEGIQQDYPLDPLLFCITIHCFLTPLCSSLSIAYIDDITFGGSISSLCNDISLIKKAESIGLHLHSSKSEITSSSSCDIDSLHAILPHSVVVSPDFALLLGSPLVLTLLVSHQ